MVKNQIIEVLELLKQNPMFRVSLTSRELFHSNFWAWLLDNYPAEFTSVFYPEYDKISKLEVSREEYNFDLLLEFDDEWVIIENKFKSLPDKDQLTKYYDKASSLLEKEKTEKKIKIILISYFRPAFELDKDTQTFIPYKELHERLSGVDISKIKLPDRAIIESYIDCIGLLVKLQDCTFDNVNTLGEFCEIYKSIKSKLDEINFGLTLQRIFLAQLVNKLLQKTQLKDQSYSFNVGNKPVAYCDFWSENPEAYISLCCDGEYRYGFCIEKQENRTSKDQLINYCDSKYGEFLTKNRCEDSRTKSGYCSFMGKECAWIYKKVDTKILTFEELAKKIKDDLQALEKIK